MRLFFSKFVGLFNDETRAENVSRSPRGHWLEWPWARRFRMAAVDLRFVHVCGACHIGRVRRDDGPLAVTWNGGVNSQFQSRAVSRQRSSKPIQKTRRGGNPILRKKVFASDNRRFWHPSINVPHRKTPITFIAITHFAGRKFDEAYECETKSRCSRKTRRQLSGKFLGARGGS